MKQTKSELKIVYICIAIIAAPLLGIDLQGLAQIFTGQAATQATDAVNQGLEEIQTFSNNSRQQTLSGYIALLGAVYTAGRSAVKAMTAKRGGDEIR
jgi:hypothetical protein